MRWLDQAEITAKAAMGGAARQASRRWGQAAPRRSAATKAIIIGTQNQGRTNRASPARVWSGINGWNRTPIARSPWNANDSHPWVAFQIRTGENTRSVSAAAR